MTREHWLQIVAIVVPLMVLGMITIASTTWVLSNQIAGVRADGMSQVAGVRTESMASLSTVSTKVAAAEERIAAIERLEASHYADEVGFRSEMRTAINAVITGLADVRVSIGSRDHSR
jgi:hypothetical protein